MGELLGKVRIPEEIIIEKTVFLHTLLKIAESDEARLVKQYKMLSFVKCEI